MVLIFPLLYYYYYLKSSDCVLTMGILMVFTLFVHNIQNVHSKCAFRMLFHNVNSNYLFRLCVFRIFIQTIPSECFIKLFRMFI